MKWIVEKSFTILPLTIMSKRVLIDFSLYIQQLPKNILVNYPFKYIESSGDLYWGGGT